MRLANVVQLGLKELRSLARDPVMLLLMLHAFTVAVYSAATAMPEPLHKAPIAIVDEDRSPLSARIADAFYLPYFLPPILMAGATASGEAMGWPRLSPWAVGVANVYSWSLLGVTAVAVATGLGRSDRGPR